jgi:arylsulfatase A-like enzyme
MNTPNLLVIMVDQLRLDCLGASSRYSVRTPNLDRLAEEGVWFENAFTPIPLCCPARQAFLNGRRPEAFGGLWNFEISLPVAALDPEQFAWPRELQKAGYRTAYVGKWHVHPSCDPTHYGYDAYCAEEDYHRFAKERYPEVRYTQGFFGEPDPIPLEHSRTHWLAGQAQAFMREMDGSGQPWHLRFDLSEPHLPCRPAGRFAEMYKPEDMQPWDGFAETFDNKPYIQRQQLLNWRVEDYTWEDWAPIVARYFGVISQMDEAIGLVLEELDRLGAAGNTFVIFTSDHGDLCGSHRMMDKHYVLYDDIVRVPLIIRWPERLRPGTRIDQFVYNHLDVPPTILEAIDRNIPEFFHGRSLWPLLQGNSVHDWRNEVVATYNGQQFGLYTQRMIRGDRWKLVWNTTDIDELYDLHEDPGELNNLIHEPVCQPIVKLYRERLYCLLKQTGDKLVDNTWVKDQLLNNHKI